MYSPTRGTPSVWSEWGFPVGVSAYVDYGGNRLRLIRSVSPSYGSLCDPAVTVRRPDHIPHESFIPVAFRN